MTRRDLAAVFTWACATLGLTLAMGLPSVLQATGEGKLAPEVVLAKLAVSGCELSIAPVMAEKKEGASGKVAYKAGESPVFQLKAVNTTTKEVEVAWSVQVTATEIPSPLARMLSMPKTIWKDSGRIALRPGETVTKQLATDIKLPDRSNINVVLESDKQSIVAHRFAIGKAAVPANFQPLESPAVEVVKR